MHDSSSLIPEPQPFFMRGINRFGSIGVVLNAVPIWLLGMDFYLEVAGRFRVNSAAAFTFSVVTALVILAFLISFFFRQMWISVGVCFVCVSASAYFIANVVWLEPRSVDLPTLAFCIASLAGAALSAVPIWYWCRKKQRKLRSPA